MKPLLRLLNSSCIFPFCFQSSRILYVDVPALYDN